MVRGTDKKIKTALISVYHKDGLEDLLKELHSHNVTFISTGGTQEFIKSLGYDCQSVESITTYPSILGGRVKTLHSKIFGGILARRNHPEDEVAISQYQIPLIDLVIVDLYPFEDTVKSGANQSDIIEKIDIGGISLIRAAAKNFEDLTIISDKSQYGQLLQILQDGNGCTTLPQRQHFACQAFKKSSEYDQHINDWMQSELK